MKYFLVEADKQGYDVEVKKEFTNKKEAIKECRDLYRWQKAVNDLRKTEGSKERNYSHFFVINSNIFLKEEKSYGVFFKIDPKTIVYTKSPLFA